MIFERSPCGQWKRGGHPRGRRPKEGTSFVPGTELFTTICFKSHSVHVCIPHSYLHFKLFLLHTGVKNWIYLTKELRWRFERSCGEQTNVHDLAAATVASSTPQTCTTHITTVISCWQNPRQLSQAPSQQFQGCTKGQSSNSLNKTSSACILPLKAVSHTFWITWNEDQKGIEFIYLFI